MATGVVKWFSRKKRCGFITSDDDPDGADIFVDGRKMEQKTPARVDLQAGKHEIRVEKENFEPQQRSISAGDGNIEHRFPLSPKN